MPTPAWADDTVVCGQVITKSVKLANDLRNCPAIGLEVGAPNITIDLNGHTIDGTTGSTNGIDNSPAGTSPTGHIEVTIKNGTVTGFDDGVSLGTGANRNSVDHILAISNLNDGIDASGVDRLRVSYSNSYQNGALGIRLISVTNSRVKYSVTLNNGVSGISIGGTSTENRLSHNTAVNNTTDGIAVLSTATATRLEHNDANINGDDGIDVDSTDAATVIAHNRARNNVDFGIEAAVGVTDGGGNRASGNGNPAQCTPNINCTP
ncbi:MAG: copper-binding protein [Streptosporangiaceae bacterium]|nr:copper-binding protein [Streptosporangiaceae bacterium]